MSWRYVLNGHEPVIESDLTTWALWFRDANLEVAKDSVGDSNVSTVFLGLDHRFCEDDPPILFETLVFGGDFDGDGGRYCTWDEAVVGHARIVDKVRRSKGVLGIIRRMIGA